ncbi:MAG: DUF4140 domain-containing protein [Bacteroidales bacterium]|nr:DUF4140 domain-containing protein [Bacteroidales bacterium]
MQKIVLFLGCIAVLTTVSQAQTPQKLYPKISDITVYNNSAQIEKRVIVPLKKGLNEFIIVGNSSRIDASSIQFNKSKSYEITDFSPYIQVVEKDQAKIDRLSATEKQTVKVLKDSIEILQDRDTELRNSLKF